MDGTDSTQKGVCDAFSSWMEQHNISFPAIIEDAIKKSLSQWLDENREEILEMIAKRTS